MTIYRDDRTPLAALAAEDERLRVEGEANSDQRRAARDLEDASRARWSARLATIVARIRRGIGR
jgi:hypothetical protein